MGVTFDQFSRLVNPLRIFLFAFSFTDAATIFQMILKTHPHLLFLDGIIGYWNVTSSDGIDFVDQIQYGIHSITETVRTVILTDFLIDRSCLKDSRIRFFGDADTRVRFPVFEQDVIMRLILLDEVILQQKSILFVIHHHIPDVCYMRY